MTPIATADLVAIYEAAERAYQQSLPLEHYMEATDHAKQREITVESFAVITAKWLAFQVFNELLVQYPLEDVRRPLQVVPDNFVVLHPEPIPRMNSFNLPLQPVRPFLVLEYVSKLHQSKDYVDNLRRYQDDLRVPYYLLYYPDGRDLRVYRLVREKYEPVTPNAEGRLAIPELFLEAAVVDDWVRYWFRGELLPLPGELLDQLSDMKSRVDSAEMDLYIETKAREQADKRANRAQRDREAAEERAAKEQADRLAAEERAAKEQADRLAAEQRLTAIETELAKLRDELARVKVS